MTAQKWLKMYNSIPAVGNLDIFLIHRSSSDKRYTYANAQTERSTDLTHCKIGSFTI